MNLISGRGLLRVDKKQKSPRTPEKNQQSNAKRSGGFIGIGTPLALNKKWAPGRAGKTSASPSDNKQRSGNDDETKIITDVGDCQQSAQTNSSRGPLQFQRDEPQSPDQHPPPDMNPSQSNLPIVSQQNLQPPQPPKQELLSAHNPKPNKTRPTPLETSPEKLKLPDCGPPSSSSDRAVLAFALSESRENTPRDITKNGSMATTSPVAQPKILATMTHPLISTDLQKLRSPISQTPRTASTAMEDKNDKVDEDALSAWWFLASNSNSGSYDSQSNRSFDQCNNIEENQQILSQPYLTEENRQSIATRSNKRDVLKEWASVKNGNVRKTNVKSSSACTNISTSDDVQISLNPAQISGPHIEKIVQPDISKENSKESHSSYENESPQLNGVSQTITAESSVSISSSHPSLGPTSPKPSGHYVPSPPRNYIIPEELRSKKPPVLPLSDDNMKSITPVSHLSHLQQHYSKHYPIGGDYTLKEQELRKQWIKDDALGGTLDYDQHYFSNENSGESSASYHFMPSQTPSVSIRTADNHLSPIIMVNNRPIQNPDWDMTMSTVRSNPKKQLSGRVEWTPQDSSYGAAVPAFGWIPKHIRKLIETVFFVLLMSLLLFIVVKTGMKLTASGSSSSGSSSAENIFQDDDHYLANNPRNNVDDDVQYRENGRDDHSNDSRSNDGPDRYRER